MIRAAAAAAVAVVTVAVRPCHAQGPQVSAKRDIVHSTVDEDHPAVVAESAAPFLSRVAPST